MNSALRNLVGGSYKPIDRVRRIVSNVARRRPNRTCCGNYGEPGC